MSDDLCNQIDCMEQRMTLARLRAEVEQLRRERDEARQLFMDEPKRKRSAQSRADKLAAQRDRYETALREIAQYTCHNEEARIVRDIARHAIEGDTK
jgi:uncharacterized protein YlxW (UPF0749 family)